MPGLLPPLSPLSLLKSGTSIDTAHADFKEPQLTVYHQQFYRVAVPSLATPT